MLLAYLKDTQHKFRHLKIILLQTTIQYDTLVKYFGNVATYTSMTWATRRCTFDRHSRVIVDVNGVMAEEMEEIFLDRVLIDIQGLDQARCLSVGKLCRRISLNFPMWDDLANYGAQLLTHWCQLAEQSSIHHRISQTVICEPCQAIYVLLVRISDLRWEAYCLFLHRNKRWAIKIDTSVIWWVDVFALAWSKIFNWWLTSSSSTQKNVRREVHPSTISKTIFHAEFLLSTELMCSL